MPIYEYGCEHCGKISEVFQSVSEKPLEKCKLCGKGPVKKLISRSSFHLKGSGWYVTDYGGKKSSSEISDLPKDDVSKKETSNVEAAE
ncbi:MAG: FmdB family transcriptional regulator [Deltaproteobacteria bacterium]|nr:MAG: FmdB family transcriptional regulator [Deltaproteobacteria bacterium]PIE74957.1 MAG: FmdB family transcriptional regulator [Deltaproteobacteria bacterium]